jgi:hypothetical protein
MLVCTEHAEQRQRVAVRSAAIPPLDLYKYAQCDAHIAIRMQPCTAPAGGQLSQMPVNVQETSPLLVLFWLHTPLTFSLSTLHPGVVRGSPWGQLGLDLPIMSMPCVRQVLAGG